MKKIVKFLRLNPHISIREMERDLGLSQASIRLADGILPKKHLGEIREYLENHFGFGEIVDLDGNLESKTQVVHRYNVGRIPGFDDGLLRFQDEFGLWKRVMNFGMIEKKICETNHSKVKVLKEDYKPQNEERFTDKIGEFYIANNGLKIYEKFKIILSEKKFNEKFKKLNHENNKI